MREFRLNSINETVDLDNPETFNRLPKDARILKDLMFREIGYAYCYMNYYHTFGSNDGGQRERVHKFIKNFIDNESENRTNIVWLQEQVFIFQEETENMC
jgi:hypothetical protein